MGASVAVVGSDVEVGVNGTEAEVEDGPRGVVSEGVVARLCDGEVVDGMEAFGDEAVDVVDPRSVELDALAVVLCCTPVVRRGIAVELSVTEEGPPLEGLALVLESWVAVAGAVVDGIVITLVTDTRDKLRGGVGQAKSNVRMAIV